MNHTPPKLQTGSKAGPATAGLGVLAVDHHRHAVPDAQAPAARHRGDGS